MSTVYDFTAETLDGKPAPLSQYRGKLLLIVNTASRCGFTPQYEGLQKLHETYADRGLVVLGFPCNQFGAQEPGDAAAIASFCDLNFGVTFPLMGKIDVNGPSAHPLYKWLTDTAPGILGTKAVKWNFTKFLVGRDGQTVARYAPNDTPEKMKADIEAALA